MQESWRNWTAKIREAVIENPYAWLLLGLFLLAEYNNYKKGLLIDRMCELSGPHDVAVYSPKSDSQELDNICAGRSWEE